MAKVSVIVPVYNSEQYLNRCLDSLVNQTLKDIEILCINDGSTDSSPDILNQYAKEYDNVKVISQPNMGLVAARKTGVGHSEGEYIGYVDSDDWVESDMYEQLLLKAEQYNADIVTCGYYLEGNYTTKHLDNVEAGLYCGETMSYLRDNTIYNYEKKETGIRGALWCKLFRKEIITIAQNSVPDSISIAEDKICVLRGILESNRVYVLNKPFYHWVINYNSMSHSDDYSYLKKIDNVYNCFVKMYEHENFTETMRNQCELYIVELLTLGINNRMGFKNKFLLRIDPYWLDSIKANSRIVVYGGGDLGAQYVGQLKSRPDLYLVKHTGFDMDAVKNTEPESYDYILIAIKNREKAVSVLNELEVAGISKEKLLWFEQPEFYWKYAKAQGLLGRISMKEKIFLWGTGDAAVKIMDIMGEEIIRDYDVQGFIDNRASEGKMFYNTPVYSPDYLYGKKFDRIVILINEKADEVRKQIISMFGMDVVVSNKYYFMKNKFFERYNNTTDEEIMRILDYLKDNDPDVFCYDFVKKYDDIVVNPVLDEVHGMYYVMHAGKKMYLSKRFDTEKKAAAYYKSLMIEQDFESPHRYTDEEFYVKDDAIVVDLGVAEGNFSIEIIDRVKKIYMFEADDEWIEAIKLTFSEYLDKVEIINRYVSDITTESTITLDEAIDGQIDFIKMDIEGFEPKALAGAKKLLSDNDVKMAVCVYHQNDEEDAVKEKLDELGYKSYPTPGYMWYPYLKETYSDMFCRGVLRCWKN